MNAVMNAAIRFAVLNAVRGAAHQLADYWVQTDHQATTKGKHGIEGATACASHVLSYSLISAGAVVAANKLFRLGLTPRGMVLGELVSAITHYAADRREHGVMFAVARATGRGAFLDNGGAPLFDQSWHEVANTAAAAVTALDAN